jgi:hypothetical protein
MQGKPVFHDVSPHWSESGTIVLSCVPQVEEEAHAIVVTLPAYIRFWLFPKLKEKWEAVNKFFTLAAVHHHVDSTWDPSTCSVLTSQDQAIYDLEALEDDAHIMFDLSAISSSSSTVVPAPTAPNILPGPEEDSVGTFRSKKPLARSSSGLRAVSDEQSSANVSHDSQLSSLASQMDSYDSEVRSLHQKLDCLLLFLPRSGSNGSGCPP